MSQMKRDEVRKILLSLLVSRKGATSVPALDREYYDLEKKRIPYRQFGSPNLVDFLQSMPEYFTIEYRNGNHYVRGISEKSKHVSLLVERQKSKRVQLTKSISRQVKISPDKLFLVMQYIKKNPNGVTLQNAALYAKQMNPSINITPQDLWKQLGELSHQLSLSGNMIYPISSSNNVAQQPEERRLPNELLSDSGLPPIKQNICVAGEEDSDCVEYFSDDNDFVSAKYARNQRHVETSEFATNHGQYTNCKQTDTFNYNKNNDKENCAMMNSQSNTERKIADCSDISQLINDKTKNRLKDLMQKHPEGIWCADLPSIYLQEYKVHLNYSLLGFVSVREFTFHLPNIFYMTQVNKTDDFKLYSADKRPVVPKTGPDDRKQTWHNRHDEHKIMQAQFNDDDNTAPIPSNVSPIITKNFAPNDVMNYNDSVGKISVTDLNTKPFLGVYIVEVFNPGFFWVHLRENKKIFYQMMEELHDFYECNKSTYNIAKIALKKDMNCACVYMTKWHRAIIKSVKPDFRVTVLFYDYGTLKTYAPEDVYYLHKKFSFLPAQAIPCGLYNVKPTCGERWKKSVTDQFIDKIADTLLCATIITIEPMHNSMMVILTDTSEEDDLHINEWLVNERLAQFGQMVGMSDITYFLTFCNTIESYPSVRVFHADSVVKVDNARYDRTRSISHDERTHKLSDVKSENIEKKTIKSLHNVPASKKMLLQILWNKPDTESLHAKSSSPVTKILNAKSQPGNPQNGKLRIKTKNFNSLTNLRTLNKKLNSNQSTSTSEANTDNEGNPQNGKLRMPKNFNSLTNLRALNKKLNSNQSTSTSEANTNNEGNTRQIDSSTEEESRNDNYMNFSIRNSDDENDTKDFGTFRSLYGGRGLMEPFDWSVIRENKLPHEAAATVSNNLEISIRERESDVENKSESHNQRNELPGEQYFLNMTRMEKEDFLPEDNIEYDVISDDISDLIHTLRDKTAPNHIITVMFAPNNELIKTLHDSIQSEDTLNSTNTNIIEFDDVASSRERIQKVDKNDNVCEIRADQKIENRDSSNTDSESVFSNKSNNKDNINGKMSERDTNDSLKSNTNNKTYSPRYKMLLDKMQMDLSSNIVNTNEYSSSEQILSSSYSCSTSNDTIILSSDEQSTTSNCMSTNNCIKMPGLIKELKSTSKELHENLTLNKSHNNPEETALSSTGTDSNTSFNVDDVKQRQLNNQSLETDSITFSNVDNTKQHQLNQPSDSDSIALSCNVDDSKCQLNVTGKKGFNIPKLMQKMLKIVQTVESNSELDSDDLSSSRESLSNTSDESNGDNKSVKLDCKSETCESTNDDANVTEIAFAHPTTIFNDCDIESDESTWDAYGGSEEDLAHIAQSFKYITEISNI